MEIALFAESFAFFGSKQFIQYQAFKAWGGQARLGSPNCMSQKAVAL